MSAHAFSPGSRDALLRAKEEMLAGGFLHAGNLRERVDRWLAVVREMLPSMSAHLQQVPESVLTNQAIDVETTGPVYAITTVPGRGDSIGSVHVFAFSLSGGMYAVRFPFDVERYAPLLCPESVEAYLRENPEGVCVCAWTGNSDHLPSPRDVLNSLSYLLSWMAEQVD